MSNKITSTLVTFDTDLFEFDGPLDKVIQMLTGLKTKYEAEGYTDLYVVAENYYGDPMEFYLRGLREETPEQRAKREAGEAREKEWQRKRDLMKLKRLKELYPND